jgi:hypothetical protein
MTIREIMANQTSSDSNLIAYFLYINSFVLGFGLGFG